jgi:undecaprenyl-diphosphatase
VALAAGDRRLARRLVASGTLTWAAAKLVKQAARRARPASFVTHARIRGRAATGGGFPSGHAGVASALAAVAVASAVPRARPVAGVLAVTVGAARVYVGAHLPLDVVGGAALGLAVDGALRLRRAGRD